MPDHPDTISQDLSDIRARIEALNIPISVFLGIGYSKGEFRVTERGAEDVSLHVKVPTGEDDFEYISRWLKKRASHEGFKYIGAGLSGEGDLHNLASLLWLENDIVTFVRPNGISEENCARLAVYAREHFKDDETLVVDVEKDCCVSVHDLVSREAYESISTPEEIEALDTLTEKFKGKKIRFISATPRGGGVALMRHAHIRLLHLWGVDASWHVLEERADAFLITKTKFHNVLQGVAKNGTELTERDIEVYQGWMRENAELLEDTITDADVIVVDDPQPSGLIPFIKEKNPDAKIIYRSHIQIVSELTDVSGTPQNRVWNFIWKFAQQADLFVSHPIPDFVPENVQKDDVILTPPTTDPLDGLNKPLSDEDMEYYFKLFDKILIEANQKPLDHSRPYVIQVARFDPSKGIPDVLEAFSDVYREFEEGEKPQLVIVGHGSVDDPDGIPIYNLVMELLESEYEELAEDVKVARLPHIDQLLNVLMCGSKVALQLSHREGFEVKVTEALMKGKPLISYNAGGIPLQMKGGVTGFVVEEIGDTESVGKHLLDLLTDEALYDRMSTSAQKFARRDVFTMAGVISWLFLANHLIEHGELPETGEERKNFISQMKELPSHLEILDI
ncbi:MAG: glycosyltransferase [Candidatus Paceibacterota bacterium]